MKYCSIFSVSASCIWMCGTLSVLAHSDLGEKGLSKGASHSHGKHSGRNGQCTRRNISQNPNALQQCCRTFLDRLAKQSGQQTSSSQAGRQKRHASRQKRIAFWKNFCESRTGGGGTQKKGQNTAGAGAGDDSGSDTDDMNDDSTNQGRVQGGGGAVSQVQNGRGKGQSAAASSDADNGSRSNSAKQRFNGGTLSGSAKDKTSSAGKDATSGGVATAGGGVTA